MAAEVRKGDQIAYGAGLALGEFHQLTHLHTLIFSEVCNGWGVYTRPLEVTSNTARPKSSRNTRPSPSSFSNRRKVLHTLTASQVQQRQGGDHLLIGPALLPFDAQMPPDRLG